MKTIDYPEGATPLDPDEMEGLKFKHVSTRSELDHLEQANIQDGLQWMQSNKSSDILNEAYVRELHRRLFGDVWNWAGTFRTTEKNIGVEPSQISVQLRILLDDLLYWIENKTYNPKEATVRFHHRLVSIHLFPNGNGRHARIMADAVLIKLYEAPPIDWSSGRDLQSVGERRQKYILALRAADRGDYSLLFAFAGVDSDSE